MEIRINKEIKEYHESLFFGLSFRQFLCGGLAVGAAVGIYFGLGQILGRETTSWLCILCAAPIAAAGFFKFNGMKLEEFVAAWVRSEFLCAGKRKFQSENIMYNLYREVLRDEAKRPSNKQKKKNPPDSAAVNTH